MNYFAAASHTQQAANAETTGTYTLLGNSINLGTAVNERSLQKKMLLKEQTSKRL